MNSGPNQKSIDRVSQVAHHLRHPIPVRLVDNASEFDDARLQVDHEKHMPANKSSEREDFNREEVCCTNGSPMGLEESPPRFRPLRRRLDSVLLQHLRDRAASHSMSDLTNAPWIRQ